MHYKHYFPLSLLILSAACSSDESIVPPPPKGSPAEQLVFGTTSSNSSRAHWEVGEDGKLSFAWDADNEGKQLVCAIAGYGENKAFLPGYETSEANTAPLYATYTTIVPDEVVSRATFRTLNYFNATLADLEGCTLHAVTPIIAGNEGNAATMSSTATEFTATLPMPATFNQPANGAPSYLSPYMYMHATSIITNGDASLSFKHIPTTLRFKINNQRAKAATVKSVSFSIDETTPVAANTVTYTATGDGTAATLTYNDEGHATVSVNINSELAAGNTYTAYALVLPLASAESFKDKTLKFSITTNNKQLAFELTGDVLYSANANNGYEIYNWVAGNLYTFNLNLQENSVDGSLEGYSYDSDDSEFGY